MRIICENIVFTTQRAFLLHCIAIPLGSLGNFIKTDSALTCGICFNQPACTLQGLLQYFVCIYFFPTAALFVLFYLFTVSFLCIGTVFMLCLCCCAGLVVGICAVKPAR